MGFFIAPLISPRVNLYLIGDLRWRMSQTIKSHAVEDLQEFQDNLLTDHEMPDSCPVNASTNDPETTSLKTSYKTKNALLDMI